MAGVLFASEPTTGIQLGMPIIPSGAFPSHSANKGWGGWHISTNPASIPSHLLTPGTIVCNPDTRETHILGTNGIWIKDDTSDKFNELVGEPLSIIPDKSILMNYGGKLGTSTNLVWEPTHNAYSVKPGNTNEQNYFRIYSASNTSEIAENRLAFRLYGAGNMGFYSGGVERAFLSPWRFTAPNATINGHASVGSLSIGATTWSSLPNLNLKMDKTGGVFSGGISVSVPIYGTIVDLLNNPNYNYNVGPYSGLGSTATFSANMGNEAGKYAGGFGNINLGNDAGSYATGSDNINIGTMAGKNSTAGRQVSIGREAGRYGTNDNWLYIENWQINAGPTNLTQTLNGAFVLDGNLGNLYLGRPTGNIFLRGNIIGESTNTITKSVFVVNNPTNTFKVDSALNSDRLNNQAASFYATASSVTTLNTNLNSLINRVVTNYGSVATNLTLVGGTIDTKHPLEDQRLSTTSNVTFNIIKANSLLRINKNPTDYADGGTHQFEIRAGAGSLMIPFKWDNSAKTIYFADNGVGGVVDEYFLTSAHLLTINGDISNLKSYTNTWNSVTGKVSITEHNTSLNLKLNTDASNFSEVPNTIEVVGGGVYIGDDDINGIYTLSTVIYTNGPLAGFNLWFDSKTNAIVHNSTYGWINSRADGTPYYVNTNKVNGVSPKAPPKTGWEAMTAFDPVPTLVYTLPIDSLVAKASLTLTTNNITNIPGTNDTLILSQNAITANFLQVSGGSVSNITSEVYVQIGSRARLVALTNGVKLEVLSGENWIQKTEWVE
jgi:hypothetical protein